MLLSIVMMIKNEEKNLDKTLIALQPLRDVIDSELIILDTGSTDNSINIALKYTDKVYFKKWNNNFADMRNTSISYASGEWILIIDADEELIDFIKLKEFFETDKCKNYNSATIELKNIFSEDEKEYNLGSIVRLFRNEKEFKYNGAIHEQPLYKKPIYNRIATFKHYGYFFIDEELRIKKDKRNKSILMEEIKKTPNDSYVNYQLAKQYIISNEYEEALFYLERAIEIVHRDTKFVYIYTNLADLYLQLGKVIECKKLCAEYIDKDKNNIDIYYYLALSQQYLGEYEESIVSYRRYNYLIDNYEISTQANNMCCIAETVAKKDVSKKNIIQNYYRLNKYSNVVNEMNFNEYSIIKDVLLELTVSLCKLHREKELLKIYNRFVKTETEKEEFIDSIENSLNSLTSEFKNNIYKVFMNLDNNYGILNTVRLGKKVDIQVANRVLIDENKPYYSELIYYSLKENNNLNYILKGVNTISIQNYFNYLLMKKRDCIGKLYEILLDEPLNLKNENIKIYMALSKSLLFIGNLVGDKYMNLFLMYIMYQYEYTRQLYKSNLSDEELADLVKDTESRFILQFINIQAIKNENQLEYIKKMKKLLLENPQYKKGIEIFIKKFEKEFNENKELKELKKQYKTIIEDTINNKDLKVAEKLITDYEEIFDYEDTNNIRAIISIYNNNIKEAMRYLKLAYCNDRNNKDVLFNIDYIKKLI